MSDNKPVLLCISNEVDLQTGKTREVSRLYGNASGMVCDVQTAERNADRLAAMRETDGAKPFDLTADQFAAAFGVHLRLEDQHLHALLFIVVGHLHQGCALAAVHGTVTKIKFCHCFLLIKRQPSQSK